MSIFIRIKPGMQVSLLLSYIWIHALVSGFNLIEFPAQCEIACFYKIRKAAVSGTFTPETTNMRFRIYFFELI